MHDLYKEGIIDKDIFSQLTEFDDSSFLKEMTDIFMKQNEIYLEELNAAIAKTDDKEARDVLHKMQGGANAIGAVKMIADISKVRAFVKIGDQGKLQKVTKQLESTFIETKEELNKLRSLYA